MKSLHPFLPATLLSEYHKFIPIHFLSLSFKIFSCQTITNVSRPSVSFAPTPRTFSAHATSWLSLWCVVLRVGFEGQWHGIMRIIESRPGKSALCCPAAVYWPSTGKAPHMTPQNCRGHALYAPHKLLTCASPTSAPHWLSDPKQGPYLCLYISSLIYPMRRLKHMTSPTFYRFPTAGSNDALELGFLTLHCGTSVGWTTGKKKSHWPNHTGYNSRLEQYLYSTPSTFFFPPRFASCSLDSPVSVPFYPASLEVRRRQSSEHLPRKESIDMGAWSLKDESPFNKHTSLGKGCLQKIPEKSHSFIYPKMPNYFKKWKKNPFYFLSLDQFSLWDISK